MLRILFSFSFFLLSIAPNAQVLTQFRIVDSAFKLPIGSATISNHQKILTQSDQRGKANVNVEGNCLLNFTAIGYRSVMLKLVLPDTNIIEVRLVPEPEVMEDVVIIASTRTNQRIENAPIKVEVLGSEEMQEESSVKPSTVLGIIGDASGVQIQQSSAVSGNANVRIQGLDGRYTQILRDGFPLYDGYSGGFGLMSIPPLDLKQIELIKGSASTLFGGGAIGGLINLISKKPTAKQEGIITLNHTTLKETNVNSFFSKKYKKIGYTFYSGYTKQLAVDVNKDGFSDVSTTTSLVIHPRLFFYPNPSTQITLGITSTKDSRLGGDMLVIAKHSDSIHKYFQENNIGRTSAEFLFEKTFDSKNRLTIKSSLSNFERSIAGPTHYFKAKQIDYYSEFSLLLNQKKGSWISGINLTGNRFAKLPGDFVYLQNNVNNTIGFFSQYNYKFSKNTTIEAGLRDDYNEKYNNFILPRIAIFKRINHHWGTRLGVGAGYKLPDPLSPQIKEYDIENIMPIDAAVQAENSVGYNAEINYKKNWDADKTLFINHAFFLTEINNPVISKEDQLQHVSFFNASNSIISKGFDTYIKLKMEDWEIYAGCTYTIAERKYLQVNQSMPYTPAFRMAYMITHEIEGKGRFCVEASYNGSQYKEDHTKTPSYLFLAAMTEINLSKHFSAVLNCENILDYRQSKKEALYTGTITNPSFQSLWAPIDGRAINLSLKYKL